VRKKIKKQSPSPNNPAGFKQQFLITPPEAPPPFLRDFRTIPAPFLPHFAPRAFHNPLSTNHFPFSPVWMAQFLSG
jgi:hypothetical protein